MDRSRIGRRAVLAAGLVLPGAAAAQPRTLLSMFDRGRNVTRVASGKGFLEGPCFDRNGDLWVVAIESGDVCRVEGDAVVPKARAPGHTEPQGMALHRDGRLFVVDRRAGIFAVNPATGAVEEVARTFLGQNFKGLNDLVFDRDGNLWFTDPWMTGAHDPTGAVYFAEAEGGYRRMTKMIGNMAFPNGITLSPDDNTLYIAETRQNRMWRCFLNRATRSFNATIASTYFLSANGPDGMCADAAGNVYVAHFNSGGVYVISPFGEIIEFIGVPEGRATTNVAFRPGTKELFITEASRNTVWRVEVDHEGHRLWGHRA